MTARTTLVVTLAIGGLTLVPSIAGQIQPAWFGTWTLNLAKSTYDPGPPPYTRATYTIELWEDGLKVTYDMVRPRGGITHLEWTGKVDGTDYSVQGVEEFVTYAYRRVDDRTYDIVTKVDGNVAATSRAVLSPDGKTITTVTTGTGAQGNTVTATTVYEKQ